MVSTKCAAAGYITEKKKKKSRESFDTEVKTSNVIGNYSRWLWQLTRDTRNLSRLKAPIVHRIVFTSTNEFSLIHTVIFPLLLPAKYSRFNSNPRLCNRELNPFLHSLRQISWKRIFIEKFCIAIFMSSGEPFYCQ